jgi:hypothetical protein
VIADVDLGVNNVRLVSNTLDKLSNTTFSKCFGNAGERKGERRGRGEEEGRERGEEERRRGGRERKWGERRRGQ